MISLSQIALSLAVLSEIVVIAALAHPTIASVPPSVYHTLCPRPSHNASNLQSIPPQFWLGLLLATTGCALRVWCYKTLGTLFTYELSLRPTHTLIRTAPYNIVRHPSYTGLFLHFTGVALLHFSPGGWDRECGITTETKSGPWILLWLGLSAYTFVSVWRRGAVEDRLMQKRFGEVWEQYARDVPCKFFPGVV
ncbi:hypothetical protein BC835DRAFT_1266428 [Cytidiella melzeri]|nr:hypothetical protein BC835DRAFT_1266428 [Cytidiella melzeri]